MANALRASFSFQPPSGGDTTLKSADGVVFLAHSLMLRLASSVFSDMFTMATQNDIVELADDAESVSLMLRFIYPPVFMDHLPTSLILKSLHITQKYDVPGILTSLDYLLSHSSNKSLVHSDPIYALSIATTFNLPQTRQAATEAARHGRFELRDPKQIERLAKSFPAPGAASVIGILGARCIQTRSLCNLLLNHTQDILPYTEHGEDLMMCDECIYQEQFPYDESVSYRPSWLDAWSLKAFCDLTTLPLEQASRVFRISSLDTLYGEVSVCRDCIDTTHQAQGGDVFDRWAREVETKVKRIFDSVVPLYNL